MEFFGITIPSFSITSSGKSDVFSSSPDRDWRILIGLALVFLVGVIVWSIYFFLAVRSGDAGEATIPLGSGSPLNRVQLHEVREGYDAKARAFGAGVMPSGLSDPSR